MAKDYEDFQRENPGCTVEKDRRIYDSNGNKIGNVCGDGDIHITKGPHDGEYYHPGNSSSCKG